ncbi:hypothetical protein H9I48_04185 [Wolbachia pipientis]|nr:hypothetical protein [Wolbachia pipientis]
MCDACVEVINSSVLDLKEVKTYFSFHQYQRVLLILYQSDEVCTLLVHASTL